MKNYNKEDVVADVMNINWHEVLPIEKMDTMHPWHV